MSQSCSSTSSWSVQEFMLKSRYSKSVSTCDICKCQVSGLRRMSSDPWIAWRVKPTGFKPDKAFRVEHQLCLFGFWQYVRTSTCSERRAVAARSVKGFLESKQVNAAGRAPKNIGPLSVPSRRKHRQPQDRRAMSSD